MRLNKKAYYFTLDAFIAIVILAAGFYLIKSTYITVPMSSTVEHISDDVLDLLSTAKVVDFPTSLSLSGVHKENTLLEAIGEIYYDDGTSCDASCINDCKAIIIEFIAGYNVIPEDHGFSISISGKDIYSEGAGYIDKTKLLVAARRIVFGYYEDESYNVIFWGPYEVEVKTWQK